MEKRGRPSLYTPELAAEICKRLAAGESLRAVCRDEGYPNEATVRGWALDNKENFFSQYTRAHDIGLDVRVEEALEIARTPVKGEKTKAIRTMVSAGGGETTHDEVIEVQTSDTVDRSRLYVDTLKWYASKMAPKRYSDKLQLEHSGTVDIATRLREGRARARGV